MAGKGEGESGDGGYWLEALPDGGDMLQSGKLWKEVLGVPFVVCPKCF